MSDTSAVWSARTVRAASAAVLVIVALALVRLAWANWPSADDYCNCVLSRLLGVDGALQWLYTQWSGRLVTGVPLYAISGALDIAQLRWVSVAMAGGLVLAALLIARLVSRDDAMWLWPVVLCLLVGGLYPLLGQTVYWPTGAIVYGLPLLLLLHWLDGLHKGTPARPPRIAYWFAVSVLLGDSIELVLPIAGCYLAVVAWLSRRSGPSSLTGLLARAIGLACGAAILVAAPGNYLRGNATPGSFNADPRLLADAYAGLIGMSVRTGAALFAGLGVLLVLALGARALARASDRTASLPARTAEAAALVLGGALSLVPVLAAPAQAAPRNALYLLVAVLIAALLVIVPLLRFTPTARASASLVALVAAIGLAVQLSTDYQLASVRRHEQLARDRDLHSGERYTDRIVGVIRAPAPTTVHAIDVTTDPGQIVNWCVATYYGLRSIRLGTAAEAR